MEPRELGNQYKITKFSLLSSVDILHVYLSMRTWISEDNSLLFSQKIFKMVRMDPGAISNNARVSE